MAKNDYLFPAPFFIFSGFSISYVSSVLFIPMFTFLCISLFFFKYLFVFVAALGLSLAVARLL